MNKIALVLGFLASTTAFAAKSGAPVGTGNFRRAEVIRAAGADANRAYVTGMATASGRIQGTKAHVRSRVQMVSSNGKVTLVKAPVNKGERVTKLTATQAKQYGLITQAAARRMATFNAGELGTKGAVVLKDAGIAGGSYRFRQVSPDNFPVKVYGRDYTASKIDRTVTFTGTAESASASLKSVKPVVLSDKQK